MSDEVVAAVDAALSSLLADKDVAEIAAVEGGLIEVVRRGRRERLGALLEGPLFALLRERGGESGVVDVDLTGARLTAAPLIDGRLALCIKKMAPSDASLGHLVEEQVLPPGIDAELVAAVREGGGVAVIGPARAARVRVVVALARALAPSLRLISFSDDVVAGVTPSPAAASKAFVHRARVAVDLGADAVIGTGLDAASAAAVGDNLGVPVVADVNAPSMSALAAQFGERPVKSVFAVVAVIGFAPDGRPRLVELHGGVGDAPALAPTTTTNSPPPTPTVETTPAPAPRPSRVATLPGIAVVDVLPALGDAPPADWASSDVDDDPGWELGNLASSASSSPSTPPTPGSFDAALQSASKKPTFVPKPPPPHPQAASLKGTGGLTFEPPSGGSGGDE